MLDVRSEIKNLSTIQESDLPEELVNSIGFDSIKEIVSLYNQAVENIRSKSDDIAAIELKKALAIFPDFIEAKILLSLCYIVSRQTEQAENLLRSITDQNSTYAKAHRYLHYIENLKNKGRKNGEVCKSPIFLKPTLHEGGLNKDILKILAGILVGGLVVYFYVHSSVVELREVNITQASQWHNKKNDYENTIKQYSSDLFVARSTIEELEKQLKEKTEQVAYLSRVKQILDIQKLIESGEREQAANMLLSLKSIQFKGVEQQKFKSLYNTTIPSLANELYYKGYNQYTQSNYKEGLDLLLKSLKFNPKGENAPYVLYYTGRCYQKLGDQINAANYFTRLVNEFPEHRYVQYAQNRLQEMKND